MKRRTAAIAAVAAVTAAVLGATAGPVAAAWTVPGLGAGGTRAGQLQPPTAAPVTVTSAGAHLSWRAPGNAPAPGGYLVTRDGVTICMTSDLACDDTDLAPGKTYSYLVSSTAGRYWVSATQLPLTATTTTGGFAISAVSPSAATAGVGLTFTVSATYGAGTTDAAYTGTHPLSITSSRPTSPNGQSSGGDVSSTFVAGVATKVTTKVYGTGTQTLTVSEGTRTGSVSVTVSAAAPSTVQLITTTNNNVVCSPNGHISIPAGQQLAARVAVFDGYGNMAVTGTTLGVTLSYAGAGTLTKTSLSIPGGHSITTQSFGLTMPSGALRTGTLTISVPGTTLSTRCYVN